MIFRFSFSFFQENGYSNGTREDRSFVDHKFFTMNGRWILIYIYIYIYIIVIYYYYFYISIALDTVIKIYVA